ncbi:MAG TPA: AsmA family protein [Thermodesulfovibrionales bacterium]|nr:AsmA family protein [Thermodesulfovibrionales bacterium]
MRKLLWAGGVLIAFILVLLLGLSLFVKSYLKSEKLKALIIPRAEEFTGRKVNIDEIRVSLFKGIVVKGIALKERNGETDFITAKEFILDYRLMPLLRKQLVIKRIELDSPSLSVKKEKGGKYNFSDIIERSEEKKGPPEPEKKETEFPLSLVTDRISIRDAKVAFTDDTKELPDVTAKADVDIAVSGGKSLKEITATGDLNLKELHAVLNGVSSTTSGKVAVKQEEIGINLSTRIGNDTITLSGKVRDYLKSPDAAIDVSAKEVDLERLMALSGGKKAAKAPVQKKGPSSAKGVQGKGGETKMTASGTVTVDTARYQGYIVKGFSLKYRYRNDVMTMEPIQMQFSGGDKAKLAGVFKGDMQFRYPSEGADTVAAIKKTVTGKGTLDMTQCEVKQSKITDGIALITGLSELRALRFDSGQFRFTMRDEKVFLQGNMKSSHVVLNPEGTVGFDEQMNILTDLKLSPSLASKLPTAQFTGYMKDENGWSVVPLKITGTTEKPSVTLNTAALQKQVGKGIQKEIERQLLGEPPQKSGEQQQKGKSPQDMFKGIFGK